MNQEILPEPSGERALDEKWFDRLHEVFFEDYEKLSGNKENRELEKAAFLSGVSENPNLDYPLLETFPYEKYKTSLLELKKEILEDPETNLTVKKIYRTKINEILASVRMLKAAKDGNDKKFSRYSSFVHGVPSPENTAYVFDAVVHELETVAEPSQMQQDAAMRIRDLIGTYSVSVDDSKVSRDVLPQGSAIKGYVKTAAEAVESMQEVLNELGIDDWQIVVDTKTGLSNFSVSQEYKIINVPSDEAITERKLTKKKLAGLVAH